MSKKYLALALSLAIILLVAVGLLMPQAKQALTGKQAPSEEKPATMQEKDHAYNYRLIRADSVLQEDADRLDRLIRLVHDYFHETDLQLLPRTFVATDYDNYNRHSKRVYINIKDSDYKQTLRILDYSLDDHMHYGLISGLAYDICQKNKLNVEDLEILDLEMYGHLETTTLSYLDFHPHFNDSETIDKNKLLSWHFLTYLMDNLGKDKTLQLLLESNTTPYSDQVPYLLGQWLQELDPSLSTSNRVTQEVYNRRSDEKTLIFLQGKNHWQIGLDREDSQAKYIEGFDVLHKDKASLHHYLDGFYAEMARLQNDMAYTEEVLPPLSLQIYTEACSIPGGYFDKDQPALLMNTTYVFSHEYIHYVDHFLGLDDLYGLYLEMRAVYYSNDDPLVRLSNPYYYGQFERLGMLNQGTYKEITSLLEDHLNPDLEYKAYNKTLCDLWVKGYLNSGNELPDLLDSSTGVYPIPFWVSMLNYYLRQDPDHSLLDLMKENDQERLSQLIEDWKQGLSQASDQDILNYYKD